MKFVDFTPDYSEAYREFLARIRADDGLIRLPFSYYEPSPRIEVRRHLLLIQEGADPLIVAGSVNIKLQDYVIAGQIRQIAFVNYPVSLGIVDPRYAMVGMLLFKRVAEAYPFNFLLGMGPPHANIVAKLSESLGWTLRPIPYLFMPRRLGPLLSIYLAGRPTLARLSELPGRMGMLWPAEMALRARALRGEPSGRLKLEPVQRFDARLDEFWQAYRSQLGFSLVRDSRQLNAMFPTAVPEFERMLFLHGERVAGYAVLLVPRPCASGRFSPARVVTLVELSLLSADLDSGVAALTRHLFSRPLDAVIFNSSHQQTVDALASKGFFRRATQVYMAASKPLQASLEQAGVSLGDMLITRADGDGPIGLGVNLD